MEPVLGAAAWLGRWFVGVAVLPICGDFQTGGRSSPLPQRTEPCQCVSGQSWALKRGMQGKLQPLHCAAGVVWLALGGGRTGQVVV